MIFRPRASQRSPSITMFAELFNTLGPPEIGIPVAGIGELLTTPWLVLVDEETSELHLYRQGDSEWLRVPVSNHPVIDQEFATDARRVSLAFDQLAHPAVAFEASGSVFVSQFDVLLQEYVLRPEWAGCDPVLAFDGAWSQDTPSSDVVAFYLSSDRLRLLARLQRELFTIEHEIHVFPEPVILDRIETLLWRYQVLYTTVAQPHTALVLLSDWYDSQFDVGGDSIALGFSFPETGLFYSPIVSSDSGQDGIIIGMQFPTGGTYAEPILEMNTGSEGLQVAFSFPTGGTHVKPIIGENTGSGAMEVAFEFPETGTYVSPITKTDGGSEGLQVAFSFPTGGTHVKP